MLEEGHNSFWRKLLSGALSQKNFQEDKITQNYPERP